MSDPVPPRRALPEPTPLHLPLARPLVVFAGDALLELVVGRERSSRRVSVNAGEHATVDFNPEPQTPQGAPTDTHRAPSERKTSPTEVPTIPGQGRTVDSVGRRRSHGTAWLLIGTGAAATALGAVVVPISNGRIDDARKGLIDSCQVRSGLDACVVSYPGSQQKAQDQVDTIATWKALRKSTRSRASSSARRSKF